MKYVLRYEPGQDSATRGPEHLPEHRARIREFHQRGTLLLIGPLGDPHADGALGVFTTRQAAEEFARDDPFVVHGIVRAWRVHEWDEVLAP